jgi:hypothetical protein
VTLVSSRRATGDPAPDLARGLGRLLVASAQLGAVTDQVDALSADHPVPENMDAARTRWREAATQLLELRARIDAAAGAMTFTGSSGEHLTIEDRDGLLIPADAAYLTGISRRMDRHARAGRIFTVSS